MTEKLGRPGPDRRLNTGTGMATQPTARRRAHACAALASIALGAGMVTAVGTSAAAAAPTFLAAGSAQQVYVTGLAPSATASLIGPTGQTLKTQKANALGGLLFRSVPAAAGYHVRRVSDGVQSPALTVH